MERSVQEFMESPLITWVKSFSLSDQLDIYDLADGVYLNDVYSLIDERDLPAIVERINKDSNAKLLSFTGLLFKITAFYEEILQQTVVTELPDVASIIQTPTKDIALKSLEKTVLLLLGCAVQCEKRQEYVEKILQLEEGTQQALMNHIKQLTDGKNFSYVIPNDVLLDQDDYRHVSEKLKLTLANIIRHRNNTLQRFYELKLERDFCKNALEKRKGSLTAPTAFKEFAIMEELREKRKKCIFLDNEVEEKTKVNSALQEQLNDLEKNIELLRNNNLSLTKDAASVRKYRDEMDILKEQIIKLEKFEKENSQLKNKLNEFDYYKTTVNDLRNEIDMILKQKDSMENDLTRNKSRLENLRKELDLKSSRIEILLTEKEDLENNMKKCLEENAMLEMEVNSLNDSQNRPKMRSLASFSSLNGAVLNGRPLSEELQQSFSVTEIEIENTELRRRVEALENELTEEREEKAKFEIKALKKFQEEIAKTKANVRQQIEGKCKDEVDSLKTVKSSLEKDLESVQKELIVVEAQKQSIESQRNEINRLTECNSSLQMQCDDLRKEIAVHIEKKKALEIYNLKKYDSENQSDIKNIDEIKNENLDLKQRVKSLEADLCYTKDNLEKNNEIFEKKALTKLQQEVTNAKICARKQAEKEHVQQIDNLKSAKTKLYSDLENLQKEYLDIQQKNELLEIEKCQNIKEKDDLKRQIEMYKNQDMFAKSANNLFQRSASFREEPQTGREIQSRSTNCTPLVSKRKEFITSSESSQNSGPVMRQKVRGVVNPVRRTLPLENHNSSFRNTMPARSSVHNLSFTKPHDMSSEKISIKITITETITKIIHSRMSWDEKWHIIVVKLQDFQKRNDSLLQDFNDLKEDLSRFKERYEELRKCNFDLEIENKRLSKIIESNHVGRPLYDNRTYQFYTAI